MIDLEALGAEIGVEFDGTAPQLVRPVVPLTGVGERMRDELLASVGRARASLEIIEALLRSAPNDDVAFDAIDTAFGRDLEAARHALNRFRQRRECAGEG